MKLTTHCAPFRCALAISLTLTLAWHGAAQVSDDHDHDHEHPNESGKAAHDDTGHDKHGDAGHEDHEEAGHDDHAEDDSAPHDDHEEAGDDHAEHESEGIAMSTETMAEFGIRTAVAGPGEIAFSVELPGEIRLNEDELAHVVPRLNGIVTEVRKSLGDSVEAGEVMAVLDCRELADLKAAYLATRERESIARSVFDRESTLFERKVSSEGDFLEAKRGLAEARIESRAAEQRLFALGFTPEAIALLVDEPQASLTRYEVTAPIAGTVILKHITLGEAVADSAEVYVVADLSTVWIDLSVYAKHLAQVREGQSVHIDAEPLTDIEGTIVYLGPVVGETTRTALARVVLPNVEGALRPGLFVTGHIAIAAEPVAIKVPSAAVQTIEGGPHVFVEGAAGFETVAVRVGRADSDGVEILDGLTAGQTYVSEGAFQLKAEQEKDSFAHSGHAH